MKTKIIQSINIITVLIATGMMLSSCYKNFNLKSYAPKFIIDGYSYVHDIAPDHLVAYWNFDNNLTDKISGITGEGTNISFVDGIAGEALQGATDGYVVSNISDQVKQLNSFTISFWTFYPKATATSKSWVDIISINAANIDVNNQGQTGSWDFYKYGSNNGYGTYTDNSQASYFGCHVRNVEGVINYWDKTAWLNNLWTINVFGNWVQWTFTYDAATTTFNIYMNGSQWKSDGWVDPGGSNIYPLKYPSMGNIQFDDPTKIIFGANTSNGPIGADEGAYIEGYDGKLDEVRIYDTTLTQTQIQAMYGLQTKGRL